MVFPDEDFASSEARVSALSLPGMPQWLGIQYRVVLVPLDLRQSNKCLISFTQRFVVGWGDNRAFIAERESENIWMCGGDESYW